MAIRRILLNRNLKDSASRRELANNQIFVGEILLPMGRFDDARRAFEEARTTLRPLVTGTSTDGDAMALLASSYRAEGTLSIHAGKPGPAVDNLKRALEILTKLSRESRESGSLDGVAQIERSVAECLDRLGQAHTYAGQYEESLHVLEEERPILEGLTKRHPDDLDDLYSLANCYRTIGSVMLRTSHSKDAMKPLQDATALLQRLIDLNPTVTRFRTEQAMALTNLGHIPGSQGRYSEALVYYKRVLPIVELLAHENPNMADHQSSLMQCLGNVGLITAWSGRARESLPYLARGLELAKKMSLANPQLAQYRLDLGRYYFNLGLIEAVAGRPSEALETLGEGRSVFDSLIQSHPQLAEVRAHLAAVLVLSSILERKGGRRTVAVADNERAASILEAPPSFGRVRALSNGGCACPAICAGPARGGPAPLRQPGPPGRCRAGRRRSAEGCPGRILAPVPDGI